MSRWRHHWIPSRCTLALQGDNVAALTLALKMKTKASERGMKSIAREVSMEFSRSSAMPTGGTLVSGSTNVLADDLS